MASFKGQPFAHLRYLQWLSLAMNHVTELDGLIAPSLETLILTGRLVIKMVILCEWPCRRDIFNNAPRLSPNAHSVSNR